MPRLHGYRERTWKNLYDCLFHDDAPLSEWSRLFEDTTRIGHQSLTNMTRPGMVDDDMTFVITNWYARTNLVDTARRELDSVANHLVATLVVGMRPFYEQNLFDLLRRAPDGTFPPDKAVDAATEFANHRKKRIEAITLATGIDEISVTKVLDHVHHPQRVLFVPFRQYFCVNVACHAPGAVEALRAIWTTPTFRPAVWIHLEGWCTRDIRDV